MDLKIEINIHKPLLQHIFSIYYQYPSNILSHLPRIIPSWKSQHNSTVCEHLLLINQFSLDTKIFISWYH
uniref:Uncharacterized protein n=1 Tax=Populus trichocarpa TaxID=3694 RepID=A0A2K1R982_POPTR